MQDFFDGPKGSHGVAYQPQLFHRADRFRFLSPEGRISVHRLGTSGIVLGRVRSTGHDITLEEPDRLTLLFPWSGRITCDVRDCMVTAEVGQVLAFPPNRRRTVVERPARKVGFEADVLTIPMTTLRELLRAEDIQSTPIIQGRQDASAMSFIRHRVARALTESEAGASAGGEGATLKHLAEELALALMDLRQSAVSAGTRRVSQAIAIMRATYADQLSVAGIARELGCSSRSLQAAFREVGHGSPQHVLATIRLDAARTKMLSKGESITKCALDCGINHLGRFATAYRQHFGENPRETLAKRC